MNFTVTSRQNPVAVIQLIQWYFQWQRIYKIQYKISYIIDSFRLQLHFNKPIIHKSIHQITFTLYSQDNSYNNHMSLKKDPELIKRPSSMEEKDIRDKIIKEKFLITRTEDKIQQLDNRIKKVVESNARNSARLLRHKARLQELYKSKNHPEVLLGFSGIMNEYVQTFMISHNFQMNVDITNMNPDHMSYEQLIELGEKIGKVSKGLSKEDIERLNQIKIHRKEESCPICCTEFNMGELGIQLRCKHVYHEQCITEWFKEENNCPICKQSVVEEQKMGKY